ncbi:MAG: hypothetical protein NT049_09650, partial [Planctomycetota bacterium]|nr:hypothetical protein [Planctomycetota bacterium]
MAETKTKRKTKLSDEEQIGALVERGRERGFLTYDEIEARLPDDLVSPDRLDRILVTLDEMGVEVIDEAEQAAREKAAQTPEQAEAAWEADEATRRACVFTAPTDAETQKRIDDPVRMYLTQMGEIPLLKREEEINLAKRIELTRKQ